MVTLCLLFLRSILSDPCRTISQTLSDGQLTASSTGKRTSLDSVEFIEDIEVDGNKAKSSLNDKGINRSACDYFLVIVLSYLANTHLLKCIRHCVDLDIVRMLSLLKCPHSIFFERK